MIGNFQRWIRKLKGIKEFENKDSRCKFSKFSLKEDAILNEINFKKGADSRLYQFDSIGEWKDIPMFSVITGSQINRHNIGNIDLIFPEK